MRKVIMYTQDGCGYCDRSKELLDLIGLKYEDRRIPHSHSVELLKEHCASVAGDDVIINTVPQMILVQDDGNEVYIGGYDRLVELHTEL